MNKNKLSVIIPIFNVEQYLPKCVDSVINQTYKNLEILLINDGSTDNCEAICERYANLDRRVKVINKENGGLSSARNEGLERASGEYIAFLDSDDWVDLEMYETLIEALESNNSEIAVCGFKEVYLNRTIVPEYEGLITVYNCEQAINSLFKDVNNIRFEVWNKVFRKELVKDIRFKERQVFEDVYFDRNVFLKIKTLAYVDKPMHNYLKVRPGNTNSHFNANKLDVFKEFDDFIDDLKVLKMTESALRFEAYALHTSIALYFAAFQLKTSKSILNSLKNKQRKYHLNTGNNPYVSKSKSFLFLFSPFIYCKLLQIKQYK